MSDLDNHVEKALSLIDCYDQAEAYASETVVHTVYIDGTRISNVETKTEKGLMLRMIEGGRQGKASVTLNGDMSVRECARMAETVLRMSPEGTEKRRYAEPSKAKISTPDIWDKRIENVTPEVLKELAKTLINNCDVDIPRGQIRASTVISRTMNSNGVDVSHRSTMAYGHFTSMYRGEHPGEGATSYHGVTLDVPVERIGAELSRQARDASSAKGFEGHEDLTMILPPGQLGEMMMSSLGQAINGENVKYGRSLWKNSIGETVGSSPLTLIDDPTTPAPLSCVFDDEGTPTDKHTIIENGILKSFLRDSSCGDSTGNGMRRSSVEAQGAYERTPIIKPLNLTINPGRLSREQIIEQTDRGILIEMFANPEADELSGRFGLNVRCGYIIKNGEIKGVVNNALLMGNMFDALKNVEHIGNDPEQTGVITIPTMSFSGTELVGN